MTPNESPPLNNSELRSLADAALDAFWQVVAGRFPGATTGDLSPLTTVRLSNAAENAVAEWVWANVPADLQQAKPAATRSIDVHDLLASRQQVAVIWSIEDVQGVRPDLTNDQAWQVLQQCERIHDCEVGFNWLLIETIADDLFPEPTTTKE